MEIQVRNGEVVFAVRVAPRSSRDAIEGEYNGALKVRLTSPPVDDRANNALRRLLAERLKVPASAVRIVAGEKSRTKGVSIEGVSRAQVAALFEAKPASAVESAPETAFSRGESHHRYAGHQGDPSGIEGRED